MRLLLAAAIVLAASGCGGHATSTAAPPKPKPPIRVELTADSHHPRVGKPWHYEVRVTSGGKPVAARIHLQILFGGVPVGQVGRHRVAGGVWRETLGVPGNPPFPERAKGIRLVFEAIARAIGQTRKADYWIVVR